MIPINKTLWAAVVPEDKKWEEPPRILEVPETVMLFESKNDLLRELTTWKYVIVNDEVRDSRSGRPLVAHIRQVTLTVNKSIHS